MSKAKSVTFTDKDEKSQRISGTVEIEAEIDDVHQEGITAFAVYIGTKKEKIEYLHLATLTQGDVWSKVIENVSTISKTHLRIYAVNEDGQSQNSFLLLFVDVALPKELGRGVKFIDQNNQACVVEGKATLLVVSDGTDIKSYVVYYGRNSFSRSNLLQELQVIPGQKEVSFNIPSNTPIDFNHTHLLIYSKNDIGESEEFLSVVINDNPGTGTQQY